MAKRKLELEIVANINEQRDSATVHGVLTELSPVKKSKKDEKKTYFTAKLTDGKKSMRVVSFDSQLHSKMEKHFKYETPLAIANCSVKEQQQGYGVSGEFELIASPRKTTIEPSLMKFEIPPDALADSVQPKYINLSELDSMVTHQKVKVVVKAIQVNAAQEVKKKGSWRSLRKQDIIIADATGCTRLVLWEEDINKLEEGVSYMIDGATIRNFESLNYLTISGDCTVSTIEDIGEVEEPEIADINSAEGLLLLTQKDTLTTIKGEIISVSKLDFYKSCISCSSKVISTSTEQSPVDIAECSKCGSIQKAEKCPKGVVANIVVKRADLGEEFCVTIFQDMIKKLIGVIGDDNVAANLLALPQVEIGINRQNIVCWAEKTQ